MQRYRDFILVGFGAMVFDFLFHTFFTTPQEVPLYFAAKFAWGVLAAYFVVNYYSLSHRSVLDRAIIGGIIFDVLVGIYYAIAYYTYNPVLSCCFVNAPLVYGVPQVTYFMLGFYPVTGNVLTFVGLHWFVFFLAYYLVYKYLQ